MYQLEDLKGKANNIRKNIVKDVYKRQGYITGYERQRCKAENSQSL